MLDRGRLVGPDPVRQPRVGVGEKRPAAEGPRDVRRGMRQREPAAQPPHDLVGGQPVDLADVVTQLGQAARLRREGRDACPESGHSPGGWRPESSPATLRLEGREQCRPEGSIVGRRDEVQRHPHERALDDVPCRDRRVQVGRLEPRQPRPQPDVRRRGLLRLQARDALDRFDHTDIRGFEQELPRERRPAQAARAEDLGHPGGSVPARNVAMSSV